MTKAAFHIDFSPQSESSEQSNMYSINTSPDVDVIQARQLPQLLDTYLADAVAHGIAESTRATYARHLQPFFQWFDQVGPHTDWQLTRDLLTQFPVWLAKERGLRAATVETYCRRARGLFRWLYRSGRLHIDASQWIPKQGHRQVRTRTLSAPEIETVWSHIAGGHRLRNMTIFALLLDTGMRRIEAAHVRWSDIEWSDTYRGSMFLPRVKGYLNTDKRRTVAFGENSGKLLQMHRVLQAPAQDERIFRVTNEGIRQVLGKLSRKSGVKFSAHDLRRTFATYWMRNCQTASPSLSEQLLELQLGHSSRSITRQHYVVLTHEDVLKYYVSPLDSAGLLGLNVYR